MKQASFARRTLRAALLVICAAQATIHAQGVRRNTTVRLVTHETSLGKRHAGEIDDTRTVSRDSKRIAFIVKVAGGEAVMVDGVAGKTYPYITRDPFSESGQSFPITFSPDARRIAYVAARSTEHRAPRLVVLDGKEGATFDYIWTGVPRFSDDGRRFAYNAQRGGKWHVVVDGVESKEYDRFVPRSGHLEEFNLSLEADGSLSILAERGPERLRVRIEIIEE